MAGNNLSAPRFENINASDTVPLQPGPFGLYVGADGDITCIDNYSNTCLFTGVVAGTFLPICPRFVMATGTTASGFVALFQA